MQNIARTCFTWTAVAVVALALSIAPAARAATHHHSSALTMLTSELPEGVTLKSATVDQLADALFAAIKKHPGSATKILQVALDAKTPHPGYIPCPDLQELVAKAISADVNDARALVEVADSIDSTCSDQLQALLTPASLEQLAAAGKAESGEGQGQGTNANPAGTDTDVTTPGTTGFTGSPPSGEGAIGSLPTATTPQTTNAG